MEIAAAALPGLPTTKRGVQFLAARSDWPSRPRAGRGGGVEYAIELLPPEARAAYVARHIAAIEVPRSIAGDADEPGAAQVGGLPGSDARDARLALLALADRVAAQAGIGRKRADRHFADLYNGGLIEVADWIAAQVKAVTPRTLARWRALARAGRTARLAVDRAASRRGSGVLDRANGGEVRTYILALIAKRPLLTAHHIRGLVADRFGRSLRLGDELVDLPPVRTIQYALKGWRKEFRVALAREHNPDRFKSAMRFAARVGEPAERLNERWQIDASPADVMLVDGRYSIYVCIDLFSRRMLALVSRTACSTAVGLLIRKALLAWGVPDTIATDNGPDFVSRATQRLFGNLGIEHDPAQPFSPEQKGHVERAIGTLQRGLMRTLPGFAGHSVADAQAIRASKTFARRLGETVDDAFNVELTAVELQRHVDTWCETVYGHAPHEGLDRRSPFAVAASYAGSARRIDDVRALDMLLAPVAGTDGLRIVTKTGLRIDGVHYIGGFLPVGEQVFVRRDEADMGRVFVFDRDGVAYLGEAIAPDVLGINPAQAIAAARAEQKRTIDDAIAGARKVARSIKAKDMAPAIARQAAIAAGKLAEFPRRAEAHETPAIAAAREAAAGTDTTPAFGADVLALQAQLLAEQAAPVVPLRTEETAHHRWHRARALEVALAAGGQPSAEELLWLGAYREGPEYRGFALTYGTDSNAAARG